MAAKQLPATKLTDTSTSPEEELGRVRWEGAKAYKYVRAEDAAISIGQVVEYSDTSGYEVTNDRSGGSSIGRVVAGVAIGAIADASYGWIQVHGRNTSVVTDGGVSAGEGLVPHASTDGAADSVESGSTAVNTEAQVFGYALAADGATTTKRVVAEIRCL